MFENELYLRHSCLLFQEDPFQDFLNSLVVSGSSEETRMLPLFTECIGIQLYECCWTLPLEHGGSFARGCSFQGNTKVKLSLRLCLS